MIMTSKEREKGTTDRQQKLFDFPLKLNTIPENHCFSYLMIESHEFFSQINNLFYNQFEQKILLGESNF